MTLTRRHMGITLLLALALHGGLVLWLSVPQPIPPEPPLEAPLRINLLAMVADNTTRAATAESVASSESPTVTAAKSVPAPPSPPEPLPKPVRAPQPVSSQPLPLPQPIPLAPPAPMAEPVPEPPVLAPQRTIPDAVMPAASASAIHTPAETAPMQAALSAAATARYEQLLVAWLEKHKKYPRRAKRLRIEGEGMLRIHIDRSGQTLQVSLEARTGNRFLDKATLAMAQRANPFPPMPENDPRETLEFRVPVVFALN